MTPGPFVRVMAVLGLAYLMIPLVIIVLFSFAERSYFSFPPQGFSLQWYDRAWHSGVFLEPAIRSLLLAFAATLLSAAAAIPAALGLRRLKSHNVLAQSVEYTILSPLIVPNLVIGIALLYFFIPFGLIDTLLGLTVAHVAIVLPFMFRAVLVSVQELRPEHEEASAILGASPFYTFRRVILPALAPGIAAGAIFAFIVSFDQFTVTLFIVQSQQITLPVAIYNYLFDVNDPVVAAVSTILIAFGLLLTLAIQRAGWLRHLGGGN